MTTRHHHHRASKLRDGAPDEIDNGWGWSHERLLAMDARFCTALRLALATRPPQRPAGITKHPAAPRRRTS
jgi:hypothetical protein